MSKNIFSMSEEEFEARLRHLSELPKEKKKKRWYALNRIGDSNMSIGIDRLLRDKIKVESEINGDFENESPL